MVIAPAIAPVIVRIDLVDRSIDPADRVDGGGRANPAEPDTARPGTSLARGQAMRNILLCCLVLSLSSTAAIADLKPGQYAGVRKCVGNAGGTEVIATSKKTIGVATCKSEIQRMLVDKGVCAGKKKNEKVEYSFQFGADDDPQKSTGTHYVLCR
jgi:hypothetical protein